ncbi:hypothetical protein ACIBEF_26720 [Micromonospora sp. NPDC050795]|uniref:MmyB family transcriptional regulator n=1 Tax=Micromonospora sp. NPDC050795 TaxID=3364282 RepID=UPI00379B87BC
MAASPRLPKSGRRRESGITSSGWSPSQLTSSAWSAATRAVTAARAGLLTVRHPEAGLLRLNVETLELAEADPQRLVVQLPADAATATALDELAGRRPGRLRAVVG